jgi:Cu(I)/Ag(I) efflux system protein CusF
MLFDIRSAVITALALISPLALAQDTDGEVRKIDKAQSKITLKHGEIKNLNMPGMTMVFRVKDAKLLDSLAAGDKVKFTAEQIDGNYVVTALVKAP